MPNILYVLLLGLEALVALFFVVLALTWELYEMLLAAFLLFAILMVILTNRLKKQKSGALNGSISKTRLLIALTMVVPMLPAFCMIGLIIATLAIHG